MPMRATPTCQARAARGPEAAAFSPRAPLRSDREAPNQPAAEKEPEIPGPGEESEEKDQPEDDDDEEEEKEESRHGR